MSKTVRRKAWYPEVKGFIGLKSHRDWSCKPGCGVCEKDKTIKRTYKRSDKAKDRRQLDIDECM